MLFDQDLRRVCIVFAFFLAFCEAPYAADETSREERIAARKQLIDLGLSFSAETLVRSIRQNDDIAFSLLLDAGIDASVLSGGHLPLVVAVEEGRAEMAKVLLDLGANVDGRDGRGNTALMVAALKDRTQLVKSLIDRGADPNERNNDGATALHAPGNMEIVSTLLSAGVLVDAKDNDGVSPLWKAIVEYRHTAFVRALLEAGADPNVTLDGTPAWHRALDDGYAHMAEVLIQAGANIDWQGQNPYRSARIHEAVADGNTEEVRWLIEQGADPNIQAPNEEYSALYDALMDGQLEIAQVLVEGGAIERESVCELSYAIWAYEHYYGLDEGNPKIRSRYRDIIGLILSVASRGGRCEERAYDIAVSYERSLNDPQILEMLREAGYSSN